MNIPIMQNERNTVSDYDIRACMRTIEARLNMRLEQKGKHTFASNHEALGIVTEEYHEYVAAVQSNKTEDVRNEILDVAVAALFGVISMDWHK